MFEVHSVIARPDRAIQRGREVGWSPRSGRDMRGRGACSEPTRPANRTEGSVRPEGGRKAPALWGGAGAARAVGPGGCKWRAEALR